jgi:hypothetical protein
MDPISMLIAAGIAALAYAAGRISRPPRAPRPEPIPTCPCTHALSFHDPKTSECHGLVDEATHFNSYGTPTKFARVRCTCRQYVGPIPAEQMLATFHPALPAAPTMPRDNSGDGTEQT